MPPDDRSTQTTTAPTTTTQTTTAAPRTTAAPPSTARPVAAIAVVTTVALTIGLCGLAAFPVAVGAAGQPDGAAEEVELTFETAPDGEQWETATDTDFGHVAFSVFTPSDDTERPAVVTQARTPDTPPAAEYVITNRNDRGEAGWLNLRFAERQAGPRLVLWLEPRDERVDAAGNANRLVVRGYDDSGAVVYERRTQVTAGGYVLLVVDPDRDTGHVTRVAVTVRPPTGQGFSRFYVSQVGFDAAPPAVDLAPTPSAPLAGDALSIRATVDSPGAITDYNWSLDGDPYTPRDDRRGPGVISPVLGPGSYDVTLRVTDRLGFTATATETVRVRPAARGPDVLVVGAGVAALAGLLAVAGLVVRRRTR